MDFFRLILTSFFPDRLVSWCGETSLQVPQGSCFPGCCWPTAREDSFDDDKVGAPAGGGVFGRGESVSVLCMICRIRWCMGLRGNVLRDMDIVGAAARRGENALGGLFDRIREFSLHAPC